MHACSRLDRPALGHSCEAKFIQNGSGSILLPDTSWLCRLRLGDDPDGQGRADRGMCPGVVVMLGRRGCLVEQGNRGDVRERWWVGGWVGRGLGGLAGSRGRVWGEG